jgi:dnd system-associated protein 4
MALSRIQIAIDKAAFVKSLRANEGGEGVFLTYGDILTFAAALGFQYKKRIPFEKASRRDPDPVLQEQFRDASIIGLLAFAETQNAKILSLDEESDQQRAKIFQEYANGGLEILQEQLRGSVNHGDQILLFLENLRENQNPDFEEFDLTRFL